MAGGAGMVFQACVLRGGQQNFEEGMRGQLLYRAAGIFPKMEVTYKSSDSTQNAKMGLLHLQSRSPPTTPV